MDTQLGHDGAADAAWQPLHTPISCCARREPFRLWGGVMRWCLVVALGVVPRFGRADTAPPPMRMAALAQAPNEPKPAEKTLLWCDQGDACAQDARHAIWASQSNQATFFVWQAQDGLHAHVVVHDAAHHNVHQDGALWDGDSLELYVHPDANVHQIARAAQSEGFGVGDFSAAFAHTPVGAQGWLFAQGGPGGSGPWPTACKVAHDPKAQTTTYTIHVPWDLMHSGPGLHHALGLGFAINRYDAQGRPESTWRYGIMPAGGFRPETLPVFTLAAPAAPEPALAGGPRVQRDSNQPFYVPVQSGPGGGRVVATCGPHHATRCVPAQNTPQATILAVWPPQGFEGACTATLSPQDGSPPQTVSVNTHVLVPHVQNADALLQRWLATVDAPKVAAHIRGLRGLLAATYARALAEGPQANTPAAWEALHLAQTLEAAAQQPNVWQADLEAGRRPFVFALRAAGDDAMQPVLMYAPKQMQPETSAIPLVVFLHGKGDPSLAHFVADGCVHGGLGHSEAAVLVPWARGNLGQPGLAQTDVLEAVAMAQAMLPIAANRIYLSGFSMGGTQAWGLALHKPELWAAVGIASGGTWLTSLGHGLGGNAQGLCFWLWHGEADGTVDVHETHRMVQELAQNNVAFNAHFVPGQGHHFPPAERLRMMAWLLAQRRPAARAWQFVSDGPLHRERSGVALRYDAQLSAFPSVSVVQTANSYSLRTQGTAGLEVDLRVLAQGSVKDVIVSYNGKQVYAGAKTTLRLGAGAPRP